MGNVQAHHRRRAAHHAQADRVFRWADAVLFLVTPEKYQMTELLPYYRLAGRYALPALYVMNKCEEEAVLEDYRRLLEAQGGGGAEWRSGGVRRAESPALTPPPHHPTTPRPSSGPASPLPLFAVPRDDGVAGAG